MKLATRGLAAVALLAALTSAPQAAVVSVRLETADAGGAPITEVNVGESFLLRAFVGDLRATPQGVFAAYFDVSFDPSKAAVDGPITFSAPYVNVPSGDTSTPGLIDEVGAFDGLTPLGGGEFLLFSVSLRANSIGLLEFTGDPADILPDHNVLVYGQDEPVPNDLLDFTSATIIVSSEPGMVAEPSTLALLGLGLAGLASTRRRKQ